MFCNCINCLWECLNLAQGETAADIFEDSLIGGRFCQEDTFQFEGDRELINESKVDTV